MSCCGNRRQAYAAAPSQHRAKVTSKPLLAAPTNSMRVAASSAAWAHFQYRGSSSLKVQNPANGHRYEFTGPGAILLTDPADTLWLASFPWLNQVR